MLLVYYLVKQKHKGNLNFVLNYTLVLTPRRKENKTIFLAKNSTDNDNFPVNNKSWMRYIIFIHDLFLMTGGFMLDRLALLLAVIGGINWGSIGLFGFDLVSWMCGGSDSVLSRIIFTLVGLSALWCISLFFKDDELSEAR